MGEKKQVQFHPDVLKTNLTESEMAFVHIGEEMYQYSLQPNEEKEENENENQAFACLPIKSLFIWTDTHIQDIPDTDLRDLCIVMYQAMTINRDVTDSTQTSIFTTMQKLGYLGEMDGAMFEAAIKNMLNTKTT